MLERLNSVNAVKIYSVSDDVFKTYGRVFEGYDFSALIHYMERYTDIPMDGNVYLPSCPHMENTPERRMIERNIFGGMPVEIGYCNGRNTTYNGFEYHKCSELNIAVTDFMLVLGHVWQIENNSFLVGNEKVFYVPKGTVLEMYQTTLHLSPCRVCDGGFKDIVVLARGTNTPLSGEATPVTDEDALLLQTNKWVIAHKERLPLVSQGAHVGLIGENRELKY